MEVSNGWALAAVFVQSLASLAWPASIAGAVWILRKDIGKLLPGMHLKHGDTEFSFRRLSELVEQVQLHEAQKLTVATEPTRLPSNATSELSGMSNDELRLAVEDCALKMREMEMDFRRARAIHFHSSASDWSAHTQRLLDESDNQQFRWQTALLPEARALRDELLMRLGSAAQGDRLHTDFVFDHGSLAGASPLNEAALRLEQLARQLVGSPNQALKPVN